MNLAIWLERAATAFGDLPSIGLGNRTIRTFCESGARVRALASGLRDQLGLAPGDRVAVFAKNGPDYAETLYAIWWAGLAAVPINAKLHRTEVQYILEHCGARAVFVSEDVAETAACGLPNGVPMIELGGVAYQKLEQASGCDPVSRENDDLAWLFYTSGTTGRPKGAMLSHRNLAAMTWGYFSSIDRLEPGGAILHAAPMSHGSGLYILPHLARACCQVTPESGSFDPAEISETFAAWNGVSMFAAPTMVNRLTRHPGEIRTDTVRAIVYGGGPMYVEDAQAALAKLGPCLVQIYGQGESPMNITCLERQAIADTNQPRYLERLGSAGQPYANVEVRVVDANDNPVPQGEAGEIITRSDSVMSGYWNNPEASAETLRNGWLHTGDVGRFDADGYLTLMDRSKDLVISGGTNIYPREVEEVLLEHPNVFEVSVIGRRDDEWGEVVVAYVVGDAAPAALDALCLEKMARFKRPKDYIFLDALPKNNYGKVLKTSLREMDAKR